MKTPLSNAYYGDRKVIYVQVRYPDMKHGSKLVSVYGHTFQEVRSVVESALASKFGRVPAKRPWGRTKRSTK